MAIRLKIILDGFDRLAREEAETEIVIRLINTTPRRGDASNGTARPEAIDGADRLGAEGGTAAASRRTPAPHLGPRRPPEAGGRNPTRNGS